MTKKYPEQLSRWAKERKSTKRDVNVGTFLQVREDARIALDAGHAAKTVWRNLHESKRIDFCYDTFLRYVNKYIRTEGSLPVAETAKRTAAKSMPPVLPRTSRPAAPASKATQAEPRGFTFNPTPNKEDLL